MNRHLPLLALALATALLALAGCGGDGSTTTTEAGGDVGSPSTAGGGTPGQGPAGDGEAEAPRETGGEPGGSSTEADAGGGGESDGGNGQPPAPRAPGQRITSSGAVQSLPPSSENQEKALDNSYASIKAFGSEPGAAETTAITASLQGFLTAKAQGSWAAACALLTERLAPGLANFAPLVKGNPDPGCPEILAVILKDAPREVLAREARIDVAAVRVEGDRGFVIYSTPESISADMPMYLEAGGWKVGALEAYALR